MSAPRTITMYSRRGCHLCEEAMQELRPLAAELGAVIDEVDIESDHALHLAQLERIPVILVDGVELCHFYVDSTAVRAALS